MKPAVVTANLVKRYPGEKQNALNSVSLQVPGGQLYGLIGADGAGKSTLLNICATLCKADSGTAKILDQDVTTNRAVIRNTIGYMPQKFSLYQDLTVEENLLFFADIFGVSGAERDQRVDRLLSFSRLALFTKRRAGNLSGGMKQKLALCCALIHSPQLLLLDEPTTGVDPVSRHEFFDILAELVTQGVTILVSTPYMDEAQHCATLAILHQGNVVVNGSPQDLRNDYPLDLFQVVAPGDTLLSWPSASAVPKGIGQVYPAGGHIRVAVHKGANQDEVLSYIRSAVPQATGLEIIKPTIEDVFIAKVGAQ